MIVNSLTLKSPLLGFKLDRLTDPPKKLYFVGDLSAIVDKKLLAVVGSRKMTANGQQATNQLINGLRNYSLAIISGLALGIDSAAHKAAIENNLPTIAVLPCGLDVIYPPSHYRLAMDILANNGTLISEYPLGTPPLPFRFIARNRIIAGLSDGLLVTQAARRSGSLHTADFALDIGIDVMAVAGGFGDINFQGTNQLIKHGAKMVENSLDILDSLKIDPNNIQNQPQSLDKTQNKMLKFIADSSPTSDQICLFLKLSIDQTQQILSEFEISGLLKRLSDGRWVIA